MHKSTARGEQFFTRTGSESTKGSRKGFDLLGGGIDPTAVLNDDEKLRARQASLRREFQELQSVAAKAKQAVALAFQKGGPAYSAAIVRMKEAQLAVTEAQKELQEIRLQLTSGGGGKGVIGQHFMDAARDILTKAQFQILLNEANRRLTEAEKGQK